MSQALPQPVAFEPSDTMVSASEAIAQATGIEFDADAAAVLDQAASIYCDYPVVWAAMRSLIDAAINGELSTGKEGKPN